MKVAIFSGREHKVTERINEFMLNNKIEIKFTNQSPHQWTESAHYKDYTCYGIIISIFYDSK